MNPQAIIQLIAINFYANEARVVWLVESVHTFMRHSSLIEGDISC